MTYASFFIGAIFACLVSFSSALAINKKALGLGPGLIIIAFLVSTLLVLNISKTQVSDLAQYISIFDLAKDTHYETYLNGFSRDFLFYALVYGLAQVPGIPSNVGIMLFPTASYILICGAIIHLSLKRGLGARIYIPICIGVLVFPQLFSISGHLIRQFLAAAIVTGALSIADDRKYTGLVFVAFASLIHISAILFLGAFLMASILRRRVHLVTAFFLIMSALVMARYTASYLVPYLADNSNLLLIALRISSNENIWDVKALPVMAYLFSTAFFLIILQTAKKRPARTYGFNCFFNCAVVCLAIVGFATLVPALAEVALRYFFYMYFLVPLAFVYLLEKNYRVRPLVVVFPIFSMVLFVNYLLQPSWNYTLL